eukprot:TRINITY_DN12271_c0_g1_i1.p1 TRINITY_DN12271_c0_g1~~TRINITY_DN12271_c0_g1_i1.p1  ORF type:complete len:246 (-),score=89.44 TRINITY_DN12271_c0_g1_i1:218-955(-)
MGKSCSKDEAPPAKNSKPKPQVTAQDRAYLELKAARDSVKKYKKKLDVKIETEKDAARILTKGVRDEKSESLKARKKKSALVLLKKIKYQETLYQKADDQMSNLETMISDFEFQKIEVEVFHGIKAGNEAIKELQKELSVEDVERVMDEAAEGQAYIEEINQILGEQLSEYDNEQCEAVLAALEAEAAAEAVALPDAPVTDPVADPVAEEPVPVLPDAPISLPDAPVTTVPAAAGEERVAVGVEM